MRCKCRQQRLVRTVETLLTTTASSSTVGPIIGQSVGPAARAGQKCNVKGLAFTYDAESTAVGNDGNNDDNIFVVEQPQRYRTKVSLHGAAQQNAERMSATQPTEYVNPYTKTTARPTSTTGASDDSERDALPIGITSEALYEHRVSLVWVRNAQRPTDFHVA